MIWNFVGCEESVRFGIFDVVTLLSKLLLGFTVLFLKKKKKSRGGGNEWFWSNHFGGQHLQVGGKAFFGWLEKVIRVINFPSSKCIRER